MIKRIHQAYFSKAASLLALIVAGLAFAHVAYAVFNFSVTPTTVAPGGQVTISWNAPDMSCSSSNFNADTDAGLVYVYPTQTTTYSMICDGVTKSRTVTVSTSPPPPPPPAVTVDISVNPSTIALGQQAQLSWTSSNATSCSVYNNWNYSDPQFGFSSSALSGSAAVSPPYSGAAPTRYTISCTSDGATYVTDTADLLVNQSAMDASCTVNDSDVRVNESVTWSASAWGGTSPYTITWAGQGLSGTGTSKTVSYSSPGEYLASIDVTDSAGGGAWQATVHDNAICTGASTGWSDEDIQDGGFVNDMIAWARVFAKSRFNDQAFGPSDFHTSPQNYCVTAHVGQPCDPYGTQFGAGTCKFGVDAELRSTRNYRATVSSDYRQTNGWTTDKYYGAVTWDWVQSSPTTVSRQCSTSVTVRANAPTATLTASPISIIQGSSSTLTATCTNSTAGTIDQGVGAVAASGSTAKTVTPGATTTYTLTCTGQDGTNATAQATVTVVPALTASCSVSPASINTGGTATWSGAASGGNGTYTYAFSDNTGAIGSVGPTAAQTASVAKTYASAGTYTGSVTVTSGTQTTTQACTNSLSVSTALQPNLTAGAVSPTSATRGSAVSLSAVVTNGGNASTGVGFTNLFQIDSNADHSAVDTASTDTSPAVGVGGNDTTVVSHTFTSSGTWYVRACADNNTSFVGTIAESNEADNCGPWTTIMVADPSPTGSLSCTVSNTQPVPGTSVTYTVTPTNGASGPYTWDDQQGGSYGTGSTANRLIPGAGPYVMYVSGQNVVTQPVSCPVVGGACANPTANISASPDRVREGQTTTVTWNASGVDSSCTITGPGINQTVTANSCVLPNGSATPTITSQSVYTIRCDNNEFSDQVVVNVIPRFIEF